MWDIAGKIVLVDEFSRTLDKLQAELDQAEADLREMGMAGDQASERVRAALGSVKSLRAPTMTVDTSGLKQAEAAYTKLAGVGSAQVGRLLQSNAMLLASGGNVGMV